VPQPENLPLFPGVLLAEAVREFPDKSSISHGSQPATKTARLWLGAGLLTGKDFILPELIGKTGNGDLAVGGGIDHLQTVEAFGLLEIEEEYRTYALLPDAERHLEERRYKDWLKRNATNSKCGCWPVNRHEETFAPGGSARKSVGERDYCGRRIVSLTAE
jgi:hypothetical protein